MATSKTPTTTTTGALRGPSADLAPNLVESFTVDVLASQSPAGPFDGAVMVSASATATGAATVTATLSVRDAGGTTELATDTVVLAGGSDDLFLYDDLDAFAGSAAGATCDQTFVLTQIGLVTNAFRWLIMLQSRDRAFVAITKVGRDLTREKSV